MREERLSTQEVFALDKRIETWSQLAAPVPSARANKPVTDLASARDITKDLPPEVAAFEVNSANEAIEEIFTWGPSELNTFSPIDEIMYYIKCSVKSLR